MRKRLLGLVLATVGLSTSLAGQEDQNAGNLMIGIKLEPPFVMKDSDGSFYGLSIDLWYDLADELDQPYEFREYSDMLGLLRALEFEEIDLAINPMAISGARLKIFEAGQPFFISSQSIATSRVYGSPVRMFISNLFSLNLLKLVGLLVLIIFIFGALIWIIEKPYNQHQFRKGLIGILDGLWWSVVTMTTVGYGDKTPKTIVGRTISVAWMFVAIIIISSFTATITSTLTVNSLESSVEEIEDLMNVDKIGVVNNSEAQQYLQREEIPLSFFFDTPEEGLTALAGNEIDIFVHDKPIIEYLVKEHRMDRQVRIMTITFHEQYRSFLAPKESTLISDINPQLVDRINSTSWEQTLRKYHLKQD